jgi:hypothetical protein
MKYESNSKNDETVHQNAIKEGAAASVYRCARFSCNDWMYYAEHNAKKPSERSKRNKRPRAGAGAH